MGVIALGVLFWSWDKSEMDPGVLVRNAEKAQDYLLGRSIDAEEEQRLRERAERMVLLRLADTMPGVIESADGPIDEALREAVPVEEWELLVETEFGMMARTAKGGYLPPETGVDRVRIYADALLETVAIAIWGTLIAVVVAVPCSLLGAERSLGIIAPGRSPLQRGVRWVLRMMARRTFDICRGFNEFVLALILVAIIGLGPFAGVVALAVHTFGVLGKVFADAIESAGTSEIEGVTASGASPPQVISYAVMPQIMPYVVSQSLLRFESNVRSASVLGIVGAGGIGFLIDAKLKSYQYPEVATMMILIILVVSAIDFLCSRIMKRFV